MLQSTVQLCVLHVTYDGLNTDANTNNTSSNPKETGEH